MTSKATFKDEQFHLLLLPSGAFMESESWEEGREVAMHFLPSSERIFFTVSAVWLVIVTLSLPLRGRGSETNATSDDSLD